MKIAKVTTSNYNPDWNGKYIINPVLDEDDHSIVLGLSGVPSDVWSWIFLESWKYVNTPLSEIAPEDILNPSHAPAQEEDVFRFGADLEVTRQGMANVLNALFSAEGVTVKAIGADLK